MAGLAEIIDENKRLREALAAQTALTQQYQNQVEQHKHHAAELEEALAVVVERTEYLERILALQKWKQEQPASERFVADAQVGLPFDGPSEPPPRSPVLATEDDEDDNADKDGEDKHRPNKRRKRGEKPKRRRLQDLDLPKRPVTCRVDPEATCTRCGGPLRVFATAHSYRLNWVPGHFVVDKLEREKCSCPACPGQGVLIAPLPCAIPKAMCGDSLLTRVLIDKFGDHIPLNRQVTRMQREGVSLKTSTLSGWVRKGAEVLQPIAAAIRNTILSGDFIQGDDTGFPVQDGGGKPGQLKKGRLWVFSDQHQAFYAFSATKQGKHPRALLASFGGTVVLLDGGSEFNEAVRELGLERGGCWSHLRRYFFNSLPHHPQQAKLALATIKDLFLLERRHQQLDVSQRLVARRKESKPIVDGLFSWIRALVATVRPKSPLGRAVTYALNQERFMRQFLDHPKLPLHNNLSELMLRQPIVGRKNWLFAGSEGGAKAACTLFTVLSSCRLQGIDPYTYLLDVLGRILDHPINRINELTPRYWRPIVARE